MKTVIDRALTGLFFLFGLAAFLYGLHLVYHPLALIVGGITFMFPGLLGAMGLFRTKVKK